MKILVTGSTGFVGHNMLLRIRACVRDVIFYEFNSADSLSKLDKYTQDCDFVYHFAAVHRPLNNSEFDVINKGLLNYLLEKLRENNNNCPVVLTSSIQAVDDTPYGHSKLAAETLLKEHSAKTGSKAVIYRLSNTFGRYARPNAHSVVATFCYNISRSLPVTVNSPEHLLNLYYINDVCDSLYSHLTATPVLPDHDGIYRLSKDKIHHITLQQLFELISSFKTNENPVLKNEFEKELYETYLSYCPEK